MSYSAFCESLGCPLHNKLWSWSSISHELRRALFSVWEDALAGGRAVMWNNGDFEYKRRLGASEKIENLEAAIEGHYEIYGVLCRAEDTNAEPRKRKTYDENALLALRLAREPVGIVGYVIGETTASAIRSGRGLNDVLPVQYAMNDLASIPAGCESPDRAAHLRRDFRRDSAVREYVLKLADGRCEYCGTEGFLTTAGGKYLETHHIIALADAGKDTIDNVIALCAEHHRKAHFGVDAEELEDAFRQRIAARK